MVGDLDVSVIRTSGRAAVLAVTGELNLYTSGGFGAAARAAAGDGHPHLILDLGAVSFCDSSGLSALITLYRWVQDAGGSLTLAAVPERLNRLLEMSGVARLIAICPTADEALAKHPHSGEEQMTAS